MVVNLLAQCFVECFRKPQILPLCTRESIFFLGTSYQKFTLRCRTLDLSRITFYPTLAKWTYLDLRKGNLNHIMFGSRHLCIGPTLPRQVACLSLTVWSVWLRFLSRDKIQFFLNTKAILTGCIALGTAITWNIQYLLV